jgi:4'-phosphopantetheinyl transferase
VIAAWPWQLPRERELALPAGVVHCWAVAINGESPHADAAASMVLSADERARATRFRFEQHARMYVNAHAALRLLLARYLRTSPAGLPIVADLHGRPRLAFPDWLHFNLSHSGDIALVAVSGHAQVGVDIEQVRDMPDCVDIARRYFAPGEVEHLLELAPADRIGGFFVTWTRKEAYIKALGLGLSFPLDQFSTGRPDGPPRVMQADGIVDPLWTLTDLACATGYRAALAVRHAGFEVHCRQAHWSWLLEDVTPPP